jgi:CheY-like chemotaxis protein
LTVDQLRGESMVHTILIVDDEPDVQESIQVRLEANGYCIVKASNGFEALERVRAGRPDLIITDVLMPVMDGFHFYKELKKDKALAEIPVIILTARGKMRESFQVVGVDDFLSKPFQPQDLLNKVSSLLSRPSASPAAIMKKKKVLVAGPNIDVVEEMILQLTGAGHEVEKATVGSDVIFKASRISPDILILDVQMPDMESQQIVKLIREIKQLHAIKILTYSYYILSDLGSEDVRQKALKVDRDQNNCQFAGADKYLGRFQKMNFLEAVDKFLH